MRPEAVNDPLSVFDSKVLVDASHTLEFAILHVLKSGERRKVSPKLKLAPELDRRFSVASLILGVNQELFPRSEVDCPPDRVVLGNQTV